MTPTAFLSQVKLLVIQTAEVITDETTFNFQVGGLMGLCLGFSFLSFVELAYWLTFRLWRNAQV